MSMDYVIVCVQVLVIEQAMDGSLKCHSCTGLRMLMVLTALHHNKVGKSLTK